LNPATVEFYRVMGYLPAAVLNYLGKLGWSLDGHTEVMPLADMVANFSLETVTESPASFDPDKLYWMAGEYMAKLPMAEKIDGCLPFLRRAGLVGETVDDATRAKLEAVFVAAGDRVKLFTDMIQYAGPILRADPKYDAKAVAGRLRKPGVAERLSQYGAVLATLDPFDAVTVKESFTAFAAAQGVKPKELDAPLRVAVTGDAVGFALHDTMVLLGRDEVLRRLDLAAKL